MSGVVSIIEPEGDVYRTLLAFAEHRGTRCWVRCPCVKMRGRPVREAVRAWLPLAIASLVAAMAATVLFRFYRTPHLQSPVQETRWRWNDEARLTLCLSQKGARGRDVSEFADLKIEGSLVDLAKSPTHPIPKTQVTASVAPTIRSGTSRCRMAGVRRGGSCTRCRGSRIPRCTRA
jgi:hypothetical protein